MTPTEQADFRADVLTRLRGQIGAQFTHQGRSPEQGFDCVGLPVWGLLQSGYVPQDAALFTRKRYRAWPEPGELRAVLESECVNFIGGGCLMPLDIILLDLQAPYAGNRARHIAVVGQADSKGVTIIHSLAKWGGVREHGFTPEWMMMAADKWLWRLKCLA